MAGLRFRAEHAHKLPTTTTGWYLYHKSKNYHVAYGGIREGFRMGFKVCVWTTAMFAIEQMFDTYRGTADLLNTVTSCVTVAGAFSLWSTTIILPGSAFRCAVADVQAHHRSLLVAHDGSDHQNSPHGWICLRRRPRPSRCGERASHRICRPDQAATGLTATASAGRPVGTTHTGACRSCGLSLAAARTVFRLRCPALGCSPRIGSGHVGRSRRNKRGPPIACRLKTLECQLTAVADINRCRLVAGSLGDWGCVASRSRRGFLQQHNTLSRRRRRLQLTDGVPGTGQLRGDSARRAAPFSCSTDPSSTLSPSQAPLSCFLPSAVAGLH